jgi:hypothetical protein
LVIRMQHIGRLTFVPLDGQGPEDAEFDALPDPQAVAGHAKAAFGPFLAAGGDFDTLRGRNRIQPSGDGIQLIYIYGHAWIGADGPEVSVVENGASVLERGGDLLQRLIDPAAASARWSTSCRLSPKRRPSWIPTACCRGRPSATGCTA